MDGRKPKHLGCREMSKIAHGSYNKTALMANQGASEFYKSSSKVEKIKLGKKR